MARDFLSDYAGVSHQALNARELEASVLLKAAGRFRRCCRNWEATVDSGKTTDVDEALNYNQKLWTVLQADLGSPLNPAPTDLRINLLRLSRYIDRTTFECLMKPERSKIEMLARINENLAEGLQVQVAGETSESEVPGSSEGVNWSA